MKKIIDYLVLPPAITDFERTYLKRMNRIGLMFFLCHVPFMVLVAYLNRTGAVLAALLTSLAMVGPAIANVVFKNPRLVSASYGFTAMVMGALLVHFGQGPMQIEMHFYFFVLIALLAVYANPFTILVAATTVALHHLLLWLWVPESVFNYAAPIWVVAVHALFVVLESIASCFIARSFFDNVIGLEKIVEARTAELDARNQDMRIVLDNVDQLLLTIDADAVVGQETSATGELWLGGALAGRKLQDVLASKAPAAAQSFELGWQQVVDDFLPPELTLAQLPSEVVLDGRTIRLAYKAIEHGQAGKRTLVVGSDITAEIASAALESEQHETLNVFQRVLADKRGFLEFFEEADALVSDIVTGREQDEVTLKRRIHTLKGTSGLFGLQTIASHCHDIETGMSDDERLPSEVERGELERRWARVRSKLESFLGKRGAFEVEDAQFEAILTALVRRTPHDEIARLVARWKLEAVSTRLSKLGEQAAGLAERLGKGKLEVHIECDDVHLDPAKWAPFWGSFVHAIRNAIDHGIEPRSERLATQKSERGQLSLEAKLDQGELVIAIVDDGRGIDWKALASKAKAHGLSFDGHRALVEVLFADGVSTAAGVTEVSGRGVGMSALRAACEALHGHVVVPEQIGVDGSKKVGTRVEFRFPGHAFAIEPRAMIQQQAA